MLLMQEVIWRVNFADILVMLLRNIYSLLGMFTGYEKRPIHSIENADYIRDISVRFSHSSIARLESLSARFV